MKAAPEGIDSSLGLGDWFATPLGTRVLREEQALARATLDDVFGFELLQVGAWGPARHLLEGARTQHASLVAAECSPGATLRAPLTSLPFASDAIDAIVLPHTLELVEDPYAVLREAERVLCAEGCLMIYGFNPFSGWGAGRLLARHARHRLFPPQSRRLLSERRLRDWVALLGFDVDSVQGYLGALPLAGSLSAAPRPRRPLWAGAYLLKARKRLPTLTLLRPRLRTRQRVRVGAAEPTTKVGP
ncbi:MAG: methyltransferase domain-containing protein [Steroidobacteraceae bacterium]